MGLEVERILVAEKMTCDGKILVMSALCYKELIKHKVCTFDPTTGGIKFSSLHCLFNIFTFAENRAHGKVLLHHTSYTI